LQVLQLDANGNEVQAGTPYGPASNFSVGSLRPAPDSSVRADYIDYGAKDSNHYDTGDAVQPLDIASNGTVSPGQTYYAGSYWTVDNLLVASDGTERIDLLQFGSPTASGYSGDAYKLWTFTTNGLLGDASPAYGPYSNDYFDEITMDPTVSTPRILWSSVDNQAIFWITDTYGNLDSYSQVYGPYY
jgi:hypothetical protein